MKAKMIRLAVVLALLVSLFAVAAPPVMADVTAANVTVAPTTVSKIAQYTIAFSVGSSGGLTSGADSISINFPSDTGVPSSIDKAYVTVNGTALTTAPVVVGRKVTMITPVTVANSGAVSVVFTQLAGITNPTSAKTISDPTPYQIKVSTSVETTEVKSGAYAITSAARSVTLSPSSGARGTEISVTGTNFSKNTTANVKVGTTLLGSFAVDSAGTFSGTVTVSVPPFAAGANTITATDGSGNSATKTFTLKPTVTVDPVSGKPATTVTIKGKDFAGATMAGLTFGGTAAVLTSAGSATGDMDITVTFTNGTTALTAGTSTIAITFPAGWTVPSSIAPSLITVADSTPAGPTAVTVTPTIVGQTLTITDPLGVAASATATIVIDDTAGLLGTLGATLATGTIVTTTPAQSLGGTATVGVAISSSGSATMKAKVPVLTAGGVEVKATDNGGNSGKATFTVDASPVSVTPGSAVVGTKVTIEGSNFTAASTIPAGGITFAGTAWNTSEVTITSAGTFLVQLKVDDSVVGTTANTPGTYIVQVTDSNGLNGTANFTVPSRKITLTPTSGVRDGSVTIVGEGFPYKKVVSVNFGSSNVMTATTDASGNFSGSFNVPSSAGIPSTNTVTATATTVGGNSVSASATFKVPRAKIELSASSGGSGTSLGITGTGFPAYSSVSTLTIGGVSAMPVPAPATDAFGNLNTTVTIPGLSSGPVIVTLTVGGVQSTAAFTVVKAAATVATALANIEGQYTIVWGFDAATQTWQKHDPAAPAVSDLTSLTKGKGYWINVSEDTTLIYGGNSYPLSAGWNLIGWLG